MTNDHRRYGWFRVYEGVGTHQVWRRAAKMAGCSVAEALAVGLWLMIAASKGRPRGNLADFDFEGCAAVLEIPAERVEAIYEALKGGRKPWIDRDRIVDWDERNPVPDPTHAERQQRYRERLRATHNTLRTAPRDASRDVTLRHATSRYVKVTDRDSDSKLIDSSTLLLEQAGNAVEPGEAAAEAPAQEASKGTGEVERVKPPHLMTRAELEALMERKRAEREEKLRAKREAGHGQVK